jgi:hypothetical protein
VFLIFVFFFLKKILPLQQWYWGSIRAINLGVSMYEKGYYRQDSGSDEVTLNAPAIMSENGKVLYSVVFEDGDIRTHVPQEVSVADTECMLTVLFSPRLCTFRSCKVTSRSIWLMNGNA